MTFDSLYVIVYLLGVDAVTGHRWRACMFGSPCLPVADAHVTPLEGGSPVGGHGDVFSGGSPWTVTGPLHDLLVLLIRECFRQASTLIYLGFIHIVLPG